MSRNKPINEYWTLDNLPNEDMRQIAIECGIGVAIILMRKFAGAIIHVPKKQNTAIFLDYYEKNVGKETIAEMCERLQITERTAYNHLKRRFAGKGK